MAATKPSSSVDASFVKLWLSDDLRCTSGFVNAESSIGGGTALEGHTTWAPDSNAANFDDAMVEQTSSTTGLPSLGRVGKIPGAAFHANQLGRPIGMQSDMSLPSGPWGVSSSPRTCIYVVRTQGAANNGTVNSYATKYANDPWEATGADRAGMNIVNHWQAGTTDAHIGINGARDLVFHLNYGTGYAHTEIGSTGVFRDDDIDVNSNIKLGAGFEIIIERMTATTDGTGTVKTSTTTQTVEIGVFRNNAIVWGTHATRDFERWKLDVFTQFRVPAGQYDGFEGIFYGGCIFQGEIDDTEITDMCLWFKDYFQIPEPTKSLTIIGDSRVHGWFSQVDHTFVQRVAGVLEPQGVKVTEYGWPGVTAAAIAGDTAPLLAVIDNAKLHAGHNISRSVALLHVGINDIAAGTAAATIFGYYATIAAALRTKGFTKIGLLGEYTYAAGTLAKEQIRQALRTKCLADAGQYFDFYIDMEDVLPEACADSIGGTTTTASIAQVGGGYCFQRVASAAASNLLDGTYVQNSVACGSDGIHLGPVGQSMLGAAVAQSVELVGDNGLGLVQTGLRPRVRGGGVR